MKYFKLHIFIKFVEGDRGGCLYDMHAKKMFQLTEECASKLRDAEKGKPVDEHDFFLQSLCQKCMGAFYDSCAYVESMRVGAAKPYEEIVKMKPQLNQLYIQVTNDCDGDCCFCEIGNTVSTKTRCKKWNNPDAWFTPEIWNQILCDARALHCSTVSFIGGNPLLAFDRIKMITQVARESGISNFEIYTNLNTITPEQISFLAENNFGVVVQLFDVHEDVLGTAISGKTVLHNIKQLLHCKIDIKVDLLITSLNDEDIENILSNLKRIYSGRISVSYFYNNTGTAYASTKYINDMFKRQYYPVSKESLTFLEKYHGCLYGKAYINLSGTVTPCPMMNNYVLGRLQEETLVEILSKDAYSDVIHLSQSSLDGCADCELRANCVDCRALEFSATHKIDGVHFCERLLSKSRENVGNGF